MNETMIRYTMETMFANGIKQESAYTGKYMIRNINKGNWDWCMKWEIPAYCMRNMQDTIYERIKIHSDVKDEQVINIVIKGADRIKIFQIFALKMIC